MRFVVVLISFALLTTLAVFVVHHKTTKEKGITVSEAAPGEARDAKLAMARRVSRVIYWPVRGFPFQFQPKSEE